LDTRGGAEKHNKIAGSHGDPNPLHTPFRADNIRHGLNKNLGFSDDDRKENIRRIGEVSKLMCDINLVCMTAFISPFRDDRKIARDVHEKDSIPFYEIHVHCPLSVAESRDPKGLYKKARDGSIKNFTGISSPYEEPESPELKIDTSEVSVSGAADIIISFLQDKGCIPKKD